MTTQKSKFRILSIVGLGAIALSGAFYLHREYTEPQYQEKDYYGALVRMGRADIHAKWLHMMQMDQNGNVDINMMMKVREEVANFSSQKGAADWLFWEEIGPNYVGGRTRALIRDNQPGKESVLYAGSVAGGVFVSYNFGELWEGYSANMTNLNIGDIGQTSNGILFVGTGPGHDGGGPPNMNSGGLRGDGLFRRNISTSGELTYTRILGPPVSTPGQYAFMNRVIGHPTDPNKLYVATNSGLMVTADAQASEPAFFMVQGGDFDDIAISSDGKTVFACSGGTIVRLRDDGGSAITKEETIFLPAGNGTISRISLALSPSNSDIIYAAAASQGGSSSCTYGVFQSKDRGDTWVNIGKGGGSWDPYLSANCQGDYDNCIGIFPNDPGRIIVGGVSLWSWTESKTKPGTGGWSQIASTMGGWLTDTNYVHADKHRILITDSNTILIASDGGIGKSLDGGRTWGQNNNGYNVTQFYSVAAAFSFDYDTLGIGETEIIMGGTQDNGTQLMGYDITRPEESVEILGGDGFDCAFSNLGNLAFATVYYGSLQRLSQGGAGGPFWDKELSDLCSNDCGPFYTRLTYWETPYASETGDSIKHYVPSGGYQTGDTIFYASNTGGVPMAWPSPKDLSAGDSVLIPDFTQTKLAFSYDSSAGVHRVFICRDAANLTAVVPRWDLVADNKATNTYPNPITTPVFKMEFSADGNHLFLGSASEGSIYRIDNLLKGLDSLTTDVRSAYSVLTCTKITTIPGASFISGLAVDPHNPNNLIATVPGYSTGSKVYKITNAATCLSGLGNAQPISGGLPQGLPAFCAVIAEHDSNTVLVGTAYGVYATDGAFNSTTPTWHESYGLPKVATYEMTQLTTRYLYGSNSPVLLENAHFRHVYIGTHGRGFWNSASLVGIDDDDADKKPIAKRVIASLKVFPNPVSAVGTIEVQLPETGQNEIEIYDLNGKLVTKLGSGNLRQGNNKLTFSTSNMRNGTYIACLRTGEDVVTSKFVVIK